jgi:hypothetical protein
MVFVLDIALGGSHRKQGFHDLQLRSSISKVRCSTKKADAERQDGESQSKQLQRKVFVVKCHQTKPGWSCSAVTASDSEHDGVVTVDQPLVDQQRLW